VKTWDFEAALNAVSVGRPGGVAADRRGQTA